MTPETLTDPLVDNPPARTSPTPVPSIVDHRPPVDAPPFPWCAGDDPDVPIRLVTAPHWGTFEPVEGDPEPDGCIRVGTTIGYLDGEPVPSPVAGTLGGWTALRGERVRPDQRLLWLRVAG